MIPDLVTVTAEVADRTRLTEPSRFDQDASGVPVGRLT
jgi:hypothetical protein